MKFFNLLNEKLVVPLADRYMGTQVMTYLAKIREMSSWSPEQIREWQNERLRLLIDHAYNRSRFYNELFKNNNLQPSDIRDVTDLKKLPLVSKEKIIQNSEKLIADNIAEIRHRKVATGGSTGDPLKYLLDERSFSYVTAVRYFYLSEIGYRPGDKLLVLGGSSIVPDYRYSLKYRIYHFLNRKMLLSSINMSDDVIDQYVIIIRERKIEYIYGSPPAIYLMACRLEKLKTCLPCVKAIISTSEMLLDEYREKIESVFKCKVLDVYGAGDGGLSSYESEPGIYNVAYNCYVEIESSDPGSNTGNIVVTDLLNYAFPFIRYRIGDRISLLETEKAQNFYNGQIITSIWGRLSDIIELGNGVTLTGKGIPTLFSKLNVKAYRIKKIGDMQIECEIQKAATFTQKDADQIISAFQKHAGDDCELKLTYVNNFKPLPNGKSNYFVSNSE